MPVTTTRRIPFSLFAEWTIGQVPTHMTRRKRVRKWRKFKGSAVRFDEIDRILDRHDLFGSIIRDLAPEFLLEGHYELDRVEAVGAKIVDETGIFSHLRLVDA
jgi:hypothetical protein